MIPKKRGNDIGRYPRGGRFAPRIALSPGGIIREGRDGRRRIRSISPAVTSRLPSDSPQPTQR
jgi:hypothetical protein